MEKNKTANKANDEEDIIGPLPQSSMELNARDFGMRMLPGEGAAMAAFIAEGKRIPRRGEIGLTSEQIESYESVGYILSGGRNKRVESARKLKEGIVMNVAEKRALAMFNKEEQRKREAKIMNQFKEMIKAKKSDNK